MIAHDAQGLKNLSNYEYKAGTPTMLDNLMNKYFWNNVILFMPKKVIGRVLFLLLCPLG